jgi:hypothetical protein
VSGASLAGQYAAGDVLWRVNGESQMILSNPGYIGCNSQKALFNSMHAAALECRWQCHTTEQPHEPQLLTSLMWDPLEDAMWPACIDISVSEPSRIKPPAMIALGFVWNFVSFVVKATLCPPQTCSHDF